MNPLYGRSMISRALLLVALAAPAGAQGTPQPGITVFQPSRSTTTFAVDLAGDVVQSWPGSFRPGSAVYLAPNGDLVRTQNLNGGFAGGGGGGGIERVSWDGQVLWSFQYTGATFHSHHDIALMPNGNVLMIAWDAVGGAAAVAAGRNPAGLGGAFLAEEIIEVEPDGLGGASVVWRWRAFDHLVQDFDATKPGFGVPADHPGRLDINFPAGGGGQNGDWLHCNGIDYNAELDQIVISSRALSEIWVIDHGTTTQEAAGSTGGTRGRGGDLLYRWGNPAAYGRGTAADQRLYGQHDCQWIDEGLPGAGHLLVFNNGTNRPAGAFSSADEVVPPINAAGTYDLAPLQSYGPAAAVWTGTHPNANSFFSTTTSGCQRLPNGNTMMVEGDSGLFIEIDPAGALVWSWQSDLAGAGSERTFKGRRLPGGVTGLAYCDPAVANSTGVPATLHAVGSLVADENALVLWAQGMPSGTFGFFLNGSSSGSFPMAGGSAGTLCLSGDLGRYANPAEIFSGGAAGVGSLELDLTRTPTPSGRVPAMAGETWFFQCWYRDPAVGTSNFTNGVQIDLL